MGNGEEWVDPTVMYTSQNARAMQQESVDPATPKRPMLASEAKMRGKMKEVSWADELEHRYSPELIPQTPKTTMKSNIPTTVERRRDPRYVSIDPRNILTADSESALGLNSPPLAFSLEEHCKRAQEARMYAEVQARSEASRPPYIDLLGSMQRLEDAGPFSKQFYKYRDKLDKKNSQHYNEVEKHIESLYLWSGPLLGDEPRRHEKFGLCGLDWRETFDFLKAPSVGGRPTVPVARMVPGGRMSRILVNDLVLQYSVPEADFLGNYSGGSIGVLGELGIQPISHTLSPGTKRITVDRTRLNGCFFFDYRGDVIPKGHQFDRMKPAIDFGRKRQIMPLNNEKNWQWLLGNFFTLPPSRSGLRRAPLHVQLPVPALVPKQINHDSVALTNYRPRQDLLHDIGNLVISVPLNQGRFECAWERFSSIRAKERRGPPDAGPGQYNQAKWYLLNCPIHRMRWIKSAVKNIYKPRAPPVSGENRSGEDGTAEGVITQHEAVNFSRLLWLDICEELSTNAAEYPPEVEEVRTARIARNRASAILRNDKHCQGVKKEDSLDLLKKRNHAIGEAIEKVLKEYKIKERSSWDKLATGWVTNDLLDDPDVAEVCEQERRRLEKDVELGRWVLVEGEIADEGKSVQGKNSSTSPPGEECETYLVIQGCTLAGKTLYGTYAWSLFEDQNKTKNSSQRCNLSSSNLEVRPEPMSFDSRYHDVMKVGITDDEPVPLSINQAGYQIRPVNCYASTPWTDLGGVRELFTAHEDTGGVKYGNKIEQKYIVVLALVTDAISDARVESAPKPIHPVESEQARCTNGKGAKPSVSSIWKQRTMSSEEERVYHHELSLQHLQRQNQLLGGAQAVEATPKWEQRKSANGKIFRPSIPPAEVPSTGQQRSMPTMSSEEERAYHEQLSHQHLQRQIQLACGAQVEAFGLPQSAAHPYYQSLQGFIPDPPPPIWRQNIPDFISDPPPPIMAPLLPPQPTHVPSELATLLGSGQYKVVAIYPSNKNCAYCNRVLDPTLQRAPIRCCRTEKLDGLTSSMSQPSLKDGQFVHAKDTNVLCDGCRCNEPKNFHELEMCFGHCGFCSDDCKVRLDEEEQHLGSVWAKMNGYFEMQQEARANCAIAERAAAWRRYEGNGPDSDVDRVRARREGTTFTDSTTGDSCHSGIDPGITIKPHLCLNWPGGWTESGSLKRRRDKEEREADAVKEDKRSKMSNAELGSPLGSVEYKVSEVFGGGLEGKLEEGWKVPWFRSGEQKESVYNGVVGGRQGLMERLYGGAVAKW